MRGGTEVHRSEGIELRAGDRIRWTQNDDGLGVVNSRTAEVLSVGNGRVALRLEDGRRLDLRPGDRTSQVSRAPEREAGARERSRDAGLGL